MSEVFKSCATGVCIKIKTGLQSGYALESIASTLLFVRTKYLGQTRLAHFGAYQQPPFRHR